MLVVNSPAIWQDVVEILMSLALINIVNLSNEHGMAVETE